MNETRIKILHILNTVLFIIIFKQPSSPTKFILILVFMGSSLPRSIERRPTNDLLTLFAALYHNLIILF